MGFYVPYVVQSAKHQARLLRRQLQQSLGEGSGVSRPGDLKVTQLGAAGPGFLVAPGGVVIQSRDQDSTERESYGAINDQQIEVTGVPGTSSSGPRRDLVIVEITDPEMSSVTYPAPPNNEVGDGFCRITVIQGVPSGAKTIDDVTDVAYANVTGYALAAINWPTSTAAISDAMIEDLRVVQSPRKDFATRQYELVSGDGSQAITSTAVYPLGQTWPSQVESAWAQIQIPVWATRVRIVLTWSGVQIPSGAATGYVWVQVGENSNPDRRVLQARKWSNDREGWRATGDIAVPASMRGKPQWFFPRATRLTGTNATAPVLDALSGLDLLVEFYESAV